MNIPNDSGIPDPKFYEETKGVLTGVTVERESTKTGLAFSICFIWIFLDSMKQVSNYALSKAGPQKHSYPIPETYIVLLTELLKLILTSVFSIKIISWTNCSLSWKYLIPSLLYTINNIVYLYALHLVSPPIWLVLIQSRVIFIAIIYRFVLGRPITFIQWMGTFLILISIIFMKLDQFFNKVRSTIPFSAVILSLISAVLSVFASIYTEILYKNAKLPFLAQQFQIYLFSLMMAAVFHISKHWSFRLDFTGIAEDQLWLLCAVIVLQAVSGICIAMIIKMLDNIVKIYTSGLSNMVTAVICSLVFPRFFTLDKTFVGSLLLLFSGIYCYEVKEFQLIKNWMSREETQCKETKENQCDENR